MGRRSAKPQLERFESRDQLYETRQDAVELVLQYLEVQLKKSHQEDEELHAEVKKLYPRVRSLLFHAPALLNAVRTAVETYDLPAAHLFVLDYKRYLRKIAEAAEHRGYRTARRRGKPKEGDTPKVV